MKVNSNVKEIGNPFLVRFKPDYRYCDDKKFTYELTTSSGGFVSENDSITDKEAYAINLASERGDMSALGASRQGVYSIPAGEKYDPNNDFSYLNRPDITIVDLDNYIEDFKSRLENADEKLKAQLMDELQVLQDKRNEISSELEKGDAKNHPEN